jgi:hypothetical protein
MLGAGGLVSEVSEGGATILRFPRAPAKRAAPSGRDMAIARLRAKVQRDAIIYAVRRAHDRGFGWIVCDFYLIDGPAVECITADVARALECHDHAREVGVKLRSAPGQDPLAPAIERRLATLLFGRAGTLRHRLIG